MKRLLLALSLALAAFCAVGAHAGPISSYPAAIVPLTGSETVIGNQSGIAKQFTAQSIANLATAATVIPNNVQYASAFSGITWAEQVNAAVGALPAAGGTVDARGLCLTSRATADANIILGSDTKAVVLLVGTCTYPLGAFSVNYFPGTHIDGNMKAPAGAAGSSLFTHTGANKAFVTASPTKTNGVYYVEMSNFGVSGDGTAGSVGIDLTYADEGSFTNIQVYNDDIGWQVGGTATGAYYNVFNQILSFNAAGSYGMRLDFFANDNQCYNCMFRANNSTGIGLWIDGASNQIYSLNVESSAFHAVELTGIANGNSLINPYLESAGSILLDAGANENQIVGAGGVWTITDNSGVFSNYFQITGQGGGARGIWPYYQALTKGLVFGKDPFENGYQVLGGGSDVQAALTWNTGAGSTGTGAPQFGLFGHAGLSLGNVASFSGITDKGRVTTATFAAPAPTSATTCTVSGGETCSTSATYYIVCHDFNSGGTLPSSSTTIVGADTPNSTNFNTVTWAATDGCLFWDILKADTAHSIATNQKPRLPLATSTQSFTDTGQASSAYTTPTRNSTADLIVAGNVQTGCAGSASLSAGAVTVTNACVLGSRPVICTEQGASVNAINCTPAAGSLAIKSASGADTATVSWAQL